MPRPARPPARPPMRPLATPEGQAALEALMARRPLLAFDFDGTLAAIVAHPDDARPALAVTHRLAALSERLPVAVVSGRRVADLRARLGFEPRYLVGNHGAEGLPGRPPAAESGGDAALRALRDRLAGQAPVLQAAGVTLEDKGDSLALHFRRAAAPVAALRLIRRLLAPPDDRLRIFGGKRVVNVVPRGAPDKAMAMMAIAQDCGADAALFAGDDLNDEPVFAAAPPQWLTLRVGCRGAGSQARWCIAGPSQMAPLLQRLLDLAPPVA